MIKLLTKQGALLSKIIRDVSPIYYESNRQVNQLIDGSLHVQVIGSPKQRIDAVIISSYTQAKILNEMMDTAQALILQSIDETFIVYILEPLRWKRISFATVNKDKNLFESNIRFHIHREDS